ncbi:hypothetical protein [Glycomyces paridis]|uniref:Uncharacterized protein n=1 Tax=Glycomyces paridis TaxID=2126555 RepID=A0A4S8PM11_9ACTN|nr:hypothetical protein [Glycomyces paridis]THV31898.1 hypothetical protein E9998_00045 [Glycomyces paridis]
MAQRVLDPAYLEAYRDEIVARFNFVTEKIAMLRTGNELGVEPGFGLLDSSQQARLDYAAAHEEVWNNLQKLRADLYGAIVTINESLGVHTDSEELNLAEFSSSQSDVDNA